MAERGPLCVGHRPAPGRAGGLGPGRRRRAAWSAAPAGWSRRWAPRWRSSSRSRRSSRRTARPGRGPGAGARRHRRRRRAVAAGRQARRHRLHHGRLRRAPTWPTASPLAADAITLSPYLGFGSLRRRGGPGAHRHGRGVYVLALTSNPEGPQVQHARTADGRLVGQVVVDEAAAPQRRARPRPRRARRRRHHRPHRASTSPRSTARSWPRARRPGRHGRRPGRGLRRRAAPLVLPTHEPRGDGRRARPRGPPRRRAQHPGRPCARSWPWGRFRGSPECRVPLSRCTSESVDEDADVTVTIPPLSDEQRQLARHAATEARRRRAEVKQALRTGRADARRGPGPGRAGRRRRPHQGRRRAASRCRGSAPSAPPG